MPDAATMTGAAITGIHHVKFPVTDLARSRAFYEQVLDLQVLTEFPDDDGTVRGLAGEIPGDPPVRIALRENASAAKGVRGFDPVSFAIADEAAAHAWAAHLDELGVDHTQVVRGSQGWCLDVIDPDEIVIRLYTVARHDLPPS